MQTPAKKPSIIAFPKSQILKSFMLTNPSKYAAAFIVAIQMPLIAADTHTISPREVYPLGSEYITGLALA